MSLYLKSEIIDASSFFSPTIKFLDLKDCLFTSDFIPSPTIERLTIENCSFNKGKLIVTKNLSPRLVEFSIMLTQNKAFNFEIESLPESLKSLNIISQAITNLDKSKLVLDLSDNPMLESIVLENIIVENSFVYNFNKSYKNTINYFSVKNSTINIFLLLDLKVKKSKDEKTIKSFGVVDDFENDVEKFRYNIFRNNINMLKNIFERM